MADWLRSVFAGRPWWINALMVFCAYMAFVYVPWDFFVKPVAHDEEVWLGFMLTGWAAKLTEPLHGAIYAAGAYGFYRMRAWMWPWASVYTASVAIGMFVWTLFYGTGGLGGLLLAVVAFVPFAFLARELWRAESLFEVPRAPLAERYGAWALVTGASSGLGAAFARALSDSTRWRRSSSRTTAWRRAWRWKTWPTRRLRIDWSRRSPTSRSRSW
jgi:hypothetical protein